LNKKIDNSIADFKNINKEDVSNRKRKKKNQFFFAIAIDEKGEQLFLSKSRINKIRKLFPYFTKLNIENKKLLFTWNKNSYKINLLNDTDLLTGYVNGIKINN